MGEKSCTSDINVGGNMKVFLPSFSLKKSKNLKELSYNIVKFNDRQINLTGLWIIFRMQRKICIKFIKITDDYLAWSEAMSTRRPRFCISSRGGLSNFSPTDLMLRGALPMPLEGGALSRVYKFFRIQFLYSL